MGDSPDARHFSFLIDSSRTRKSLLLSFGTMEDLPEQTSTRGTLSMEGFYSIGFSGHCLMVGTETIYAAVRNDIAVISLRHRIAAFRVYKVLYPYVFPARPDKHDPFRRILRCAENCNEFHM